MKLEQSFEVDAPLETVWAALIDVQRVAPCLPGASIEASHSWDRPSTARRSSSIGSASRAASRRRSSR